MWKFYFIFKLGAFSVKSKRKGGGASFILITQCITVVSLSIIVFIVKPLLVKIYEYVQELFKVLFKLRLNRLPPSLSDSTRCFSETSGFLWDNLNMHLKNIGLKNKGLKTKDWRKLHPNVQTLQSCLLEVDRPPSSWLSAYFTDFITHNSFLQYRCDIIRLIMHLKQLRY